MPIRTACFGGAPRRPSKAGERFLRTIPLPRTDNCPPEITAPPPFSLRCATRRKMLWPGWMRSIRFSLFRTPPPFTSAPPPSFERRRVLHDEPPAESSSPRRQALHFPTCVGASAAARACERIRHALTLLSLRRSGPTGRKAHTVWRIWESERAIQGKREELIECIKARNL